MAANTAPIFVKSITGKGASWTNSDAANIKKAICPTIGTNGTRLHSISVTSTDTMARDFALYLNDGTTDFQVGRIQVPIGAGTADGVASLSVLTQAALLPWLSIDGSLLIPAGWTLKAENLSQVASTKAVTFVALGGDY